VSGNTRGIPYAYVSDDGRARICPRCNERIEGVDESQETEEDAITKGASQAYAQHYEREHAPAEDAHLEADYEDRTYLADD
jgi:hypothetical protein